MIGNVCYERRDGVAEDWVGGLQVAVGGNEQAHEAPGEQKKRDK